jgi:hypothetical protein
MTDNDLAVISAFYDHEPVNIESLATALESSEARALLVDLVRLRQAVCADAATLPSSLAAPRANGARLSSIRISLPLATAAAIVAALLSVFVVRHLASAIPAPPTPIATVRFEPGVDWRNAP